MNNYTDLEIAILSSLLQRPNLMKKIFIDDKYFKRFKAMWLFMKSFYKKFGNFDLNLMYSVCKNKYHLMSNIELLIDSEPSPSLIVEYQEQLIKEYDEIKKDKWIREKIYELASDLLVMKITTEDFKYNVGKIYSDANEIFKNELDTQN